LAALLCSTSFAASVVGDVNSSGSVDAVDVQLVINEALGIETGYPCDINADGDADALDLQLAIGAALGTEIVYQAHRMPVSDDMDRDLLADSEEEAIGYDPNNADEDGNDVADGVDLALALYSQIDQLDWYWEEWVGGPDVSDPPTIEQELPTDRIYAIHFEYMYDCQWICSVCGEGTTVGHLQIVNPDLHATWEEGFILPLDALHFMEYGSFSYSSACGDPHEGRVDVQGLLEVLPVGAGESVNFSDYWPFAVGNRWESELIYDGGFTLEITGHFLVNGFEIWEFTDSFGAIWGGEDRLFYYVYVDGALHATENLSDLDSLPEATGDLKPHYPETVQIGVPVETQILVPMLGGTTAPLQGTVTALQGSLRSVLEDTPYTVDNFPLGDQPDVLAFVGQGGGLIVFGRGLGPMKLIDYVADAVVGGSGQQLAKPGLSEHYEPYVNPVEPNAPGYTLPLDLETVANYDAVDWRLHLGSVVPLLEQNGFAVIEYDFGDSRDDIVAPYEMLHERMGVPVFITADTLLHLYHVQFDETLKDVEEREFFEDIRALTEVLLEDALALYDAYTGDLKEAARRNIAYLAVAQQLIDPDADVPELVTDVVAHELAKIDAHGGFQESDIFIYEEDYSQYVPRGHYTRSDELERYFKTLMWYGRMAFLLKGAEAWGPSGDALISVYDARIQTLHAVLLATGLEAVEVGERTGREVWDRIYAVTSFYVGLADDLTPHEYIETLGQVFGNEFMPTDLEDEDNYFALKVELSLLRSPAIYGGTGNIYIAPPVTPESLDEVLENTKGMRFMGQRFIPDSYMFQHLVFPEVLDYTGDWDPQPFTLGNTGVRWARCYPRGLDVMAILGSSCAETILAAEGDTDYVDYALRFDELKGEFDAFDVSDWNRNLYWGWLYSLQALIGEFPVGYPNFMRTEAWEKKELNAALASWTELRHDTILYAKQSYTPGETSIPPVPEVTGYVEPVPEFYGRLLALTRMTRQGLSDFDALSEQAADRLETLEDVLSRLIEIANKELANQPLSGDDYEYIEAFGETVEEAVVGVEDEGVKTTLVADVHTHGVEGKVVEEGVGNVDLILVACPIANGSVVLAAGPVLSYYEFKHPMDDRLTDEAWRDLLDSPQKPDRPDWYQDLVEER